jgi:alkylhydroperoxidase/carboxymuconolactone decarboxylase family protein YurZ
MAKEAEFFNVKYKEGSLDPKTNHLIRLAVCLATAHEEGAKNHLAHCRELGASEDEIWETVVYAMRVPAAKVRYFAQRIIGAKQAPA